MQQHRTTSLTSVIDSNATDGQNNVATVKRTSRVSKKLIWLTGFVSGATQSSYKDTNLYPITNKITNGHLRRNFRAFMSNLTKQQHHVSFDQAA